MILEPQEDQTPLTEFEVPRGLRKRTSHGPYAFGFQTKKRATEASLETEQNLRNQSKVFSKQQIFPIKRTVLLLRLAALLF